MDGAIEWFQMTTPGVKPKEKPKPMSSFIDQIRKLPGTKQVSHGQSE